MAHSLHLSPLSIPSETAEPTSTPEETVLYLFDTTRPALLRYAISFGLTAHDAEDLLQEVFLALLHHLRLGRPSHNLHGWLFRVTHNLTLKRRMRNRRLAVSAQDLPAEDLADCALDPEACLLHTERERRLAEVFRALPERDRQCLQLRAEGLNYREIARIAGISLGSVSAAITRATARLSTVQQRKSR